MHVQRVWPSASLSHTPRTQPTCVCLTRPLPQQSSWAHPTIPFSEASCGIRQPARAVRSQALVGVRPRGPLLGTWAAPRRDRALRCPGGKPAVSGDPQEPERKGCYRCGPIPQGRRHVSPGSCGWKVSEPERSHQSASLDQHSAPGLGAAAGPRAPSSCHTVTLTCVGEKAGDGREGGGQPWSPILLRLKGRAALARGAESPAL